jgi:hypothetical protein
MFERLKSALQAATNEYREYPNRMARRLKQRVESNLDIAFSHLAENTGAETYDFVTEYIKRPNGPQAETFLEAIGGLDVQLQLPFVQAAALSDKMFVVLPAVQKWARANSSLIAALATHRRASNEPERLKA